MRPASRRAPPAIGYAMSGQIVGEVLAASASIKAAGLPPRAFHGLIAIAEKAGTDTRQGSVPWSHIRAALYGASLRTAERAVEDLRKAGLVRVVRPGFNNNNGRACAPVYQVAPLGAPATQVAGSPCTDSDTQVSGSGRVRSRQNGDRSRQSADRSRHSGVGLNGSINGSINERALSARVGEQTDTTAPRSTVTGWLDAADCAPSAIATAEPLSAPARQCPWCQDTGLVLMSDGTPGSDPSACNHDNSRRPATSDDVAEYERRRRLA